MNPPKTKGIVTFYSQDNNTAPGKEGVYEIRIYCVDMPVICTYAYAIVKKKAAGDTDKQ